MLYKFLTVLSIFSATFVFASDLPNVGEKRELSEEPFQDLAPAKRKAIFLLHQACEEGDIEKVKGLLNPQNINEKDNNGNTPTLVAFLAGHYDIVDFLLLKENTNINDCNKERDTLLHLACQNLSQEDAVKIIRTLIACPLRIFINACNKKHQTPLYLACANNNLSAVKELLKHPDIDVNFSDLYLHGPLHVACLTENSEEVVEQLLTHPDLDVEKCCRRVMCKEVSKYEDLNGACEIRPREHMDYLNPLHLACEKGNKKVVKLLLNTKKIPTDLKTNTFEHSFLTTAIKYNKPKIVKFLFKQGYGDIDNCRCGHGIFEVIIGYIKNNKEINSDDEVIIGAFIEYQWKKLNYLCRGNFFKNCINNLKTNVIKFILENRRIDNSIFKVDLLFYSCCRNCIDSVKVLIEDFNVDINLRQGARSLLDMALEMYCDCSDKEALKNIIKYLLERDAVYSESFNEHEDIQPLLEEIKTKILAENTLPKILILEPIEPPK
jgi:ankyrin repeat protein